VTTKAAQPAQLRDHCPQVGAQWWAEWGASLFSQRRSSRKRRHKATETCDSVGQMTCESQKFWRKEGTQTSQGETAPTVDEAISGVA